MNPQSGLVSAGYAGKMKRFEGLQTTRLASLGLLQVGPLLSAWDTR